MCSRFALDTGATYTMLMPGDALTMGIDYRLLGDEVDLATAGGRTSAFQEPAELVFEDRATSRAYSYLVLLTIAPLSTEISHLPSLLGRDIINRWRIDYHPTSSELRCEVITADEVVELLA